MGGGEWLVVRGLGGGVGWLWDMCSAELVMEPVVDAVEQAPPEVLGRGGRRAGSEAARKRKSRSEQAAVAAVPAVQPCGSLALGLACGQDESCHPSAAVGNQSP